jgi:hypothetical protein
MRLRYGVMNFLEKHVPQSAAERIAAFVAVSLMLHGWLVLFPYLGLRTEFALPAQGTPSTSRQVLSVSLSGSAQSASAEKAAPEPQGQNNGQADATNESNAGIPAPVGPLPTKGVNMIPTDGVPFYPAQALTERPQPVENTNLDDVEVSAPGSGTMVASLWIDDLGRVIKVEVESSELPRPVAIAIAAKLQKARFTPGLRGGVPVGSIMKIEINYEDFAKH